MRFSFFPAHIFDLKWKIAEVCILVITFILVSLFMSLPIESVGLFLIPFVSVNSAFILYKYSKTGELSFEPDFVPNKLQIVGIVLLWLFSSLGMIYFVQGQQFLVISAIGGLIFAGLDVSRYVAFYRAYTVHVNFHQDEHSVAALEWEEAARAFQLANHYHANERKGSALVWWVFSVGRYNRVLWKLLDSGYKSKNDPEYKAAELHMKASKTALQSEIVRFFNVDNSRRLFTKAVDLIAEADTNLSLFRCTICGEIHHRRDLIRMLNEHNIAETEVCTSCFETHWTTCPSCSRTVRDEQLIGDGCVYCEKNRVSGGVVETTTEELVDDALQTLEIERPLSEEKIESAYRTRVKDVHPDMGGSSKEFTDVKESKELLLKYITEK